MPLPTLFLATVIGVTDGATLTVLHNRQALSVHLAEIDAPAPERAFGAKSRQQLGKLCRGVKAEIRPQFANRGGGIVADVVCAGKDAGAEQVRSGLAMVDEQHSTKRMLYEAQADARRQRRGLWSDPGIVRSWENPAKPNNKPARTTQLSAGADRG